MIASGIYAITHRESGRAYIGSAVNLNRRWAVHRCRLNKGSHHCPPLQAAWSKYGEAAFDFAVLQHCDHSELLNAEQALIDKLAPYFNVMRIVSIPPMFGRNHSVRAIAKMSASAKSRKRPSPSAETRAKISAKNKGRPLTAEHRAKLAAAKLGVKRGTYSAEHCAHISAGLKASWALRA